MFVYLLIICYFCCLKLSTMATYKLPYFGKITLSEDDDYHKVEEVGIHSDNNFSLLNIFRSYFDFTYELVVHVIIVIVYL